MLPFSDSNQMRLVLVLGHFLWQGALIAALLAGVVSILRVRSPRVRYVASLISLLLMAACPVATWCWLPIDEQPAPPVSTPVSGTTGDSFGAPILPTRNVEVAGKSTRPNTVSDPDLQFVLGAPDHGFVPPIPGDLSPSTTGGPDAPTMAPVSGRLQDSHTGNRSLSGIANNEAAWWQPAAPWILTAWLIGVAFLSLRLMIGTIATWRWRRQLEPLPQGLALIVNSLCGRLGMRVPRVALSSRVTEAVAIGLLRPLILLPVSWATSIPSDMLEGIVAHELAHIRRYDLWVNLFQRVLETFFFYHPVVWWLSNRLRTERELCCDDLAVSVTNDHVRYAEMLEHVGRMRLSMRPSPVAVSIANPRHALLERVRHVLRLEVRDDKRGSSVIAALVLAIAALTGAMLTSQTMLSAGEWSWNKMLQTSLGEDRHHAIFLHNGKQSAFVVVRLDPPGTESSFNGLRSTRSKRGGTIVQKNFTISFNATRNNHPLESLTINGKSFSLDKGRVLVMGDEYEIIQLPVHEPELVTHENLKLFVQNAVDQAKKLAKDAVAAVLKASTEEEYKAQTQIPAKGTVETPIVERTEGPRVVTQDGLQSQDRSLELERPRETPVTDPATPGLPSQSLNPAPATPVNVAALTAPPLPQDFKAMVEQLSKLLPQHWRHPHVVNERTIEITPGMYLPFEERPHVIIAFTDDKARPTVRYERQDEQYEYVGETRYGHAHVFVSMKTVGTDFGWMDDYFAWPEAAEFCKAFLKRDAHQIEMLKTKADDREWKHNGYGPIRNGMRLKWTPSFKMAEPGKPLVIGLAVTNFGDTDAKYGSHLAEPARTWQLSGPDGKLVPLRLPVSKLEQPDSVPAVLEKGHSRSLYAETDLIKLFDITQPGRYVLSFNGKTVRNESGSESEGSSKDTFLPSSLDFVFVIPNSETQQRIDDFSAAVLAQGMGPDLMPLKDANGAARDVKFSASAAPEKFVLMVGEPIWIHFKVMNQTSTDKRAIVGGDYRNALGRPDSFKVDIFDADGQRVAQPDIGLDMGGISHTEPLPAKKEAVFKLFLPHWATITKPGKYRMTIWRSLDVVPSEKDGGQDAFALKPEKFTVAAETTFTVVSPDETKFGALIEQLGPKLISENSDDAENADTMLKSIRVPIEWSIRAAAKLDSGSTPLPERPEDRAIGQPLSDAKQRAETPGKQGNEERTGRIAHPTERLVVDERAVPWYVKCLAQPRGSRKVSALNFLGRCRSETALNAIAKSFEVTARDITDTTNQGLAESSARNVHHVATHALSMFATNQPQHSLATKQLFSLADDPYMPIRLTVLHFCATNKSPEARTIINTMTTDKDEALATEAKRYQKLLAEADRLPEHSALDRGIQFLKSQQRDDGTWPEQENSMVGGKSALAVLALLQAGVKSDDAAIQKALPKLRQLEPKLVYVVALQTMALCAATPQQDADVIRRNVAWLEAAQASNGRATGGWRYQHRKDSNDADGSNTRFAVMALDAAKQAKFEVRAETWQRVATYWLTGQLESGGFGYTSGPPQSYSMTLAGVYCLATANRHLPQDGQSATREAAIKKGLQFASQRRQTEPMPHPLYTDHCLKLAGHLFDAHGLGHIDWRSPVVNRLIEGQRQDGAWKGGSTEDELVGTSFGLMILSEQTEGRKSSSTTVSEAISPKLRKDRIAAHDKAEAAKLVGDWKVTMPRGFAFSARIQQMPDGLLQLSNARAFNGIYTLKDQRLECVVTGTERNRNFAQQFEGTLDDPKKARPVLDRTRDFAWKQQADGSFLLVEEDHSSGAKYIGATLQKAEKTLSDSTWADQMFSELRLDFGKVERRTKLTHVIQITNSFRETITIGDISVSRGPFAAMIDRRELRAAEAAELVITLEPTRWVKKQSRKVSVPVAYKDRDGKEVSQIVQLELQVEIASDEKKVPAADQNGAMRLLPVEKLIADKRLDAWATRVESQTND